MAESEEMPEVPAEAFELLKEAMREAEARSGATEPLKWGEERGDKTEDGRVVWQKAADALGGRATRPLYYHPDGLPILDDDLLPATVKCGMLMNERCHVGSTRTLYGERLSTVWLGLDHSFSMSGPPLIFETMLFAPDPKQVVRRSLQSFSRTIQGEKPQPEDDELEREAEAHAAYVKKNFPHDQLQLRYATKSEAEESHRKLRLQCLIPPKWRRFLCFEIGGDATWE